MRGVVRVVGLSKSLVMDELNEDDVKDMKERKTRSHTTLYDG